MVIARKSVRRKGGKHTLVPPNALIRENDMKGKAMIVYVFILTAVAATVMGQLVLKYAISRYGEIPNNIREGLRFLVRALLNPLVILCFAFGFIAALAWIAAVSKSDLSFAYPFVSLSYPLVLLFASLLLKESVPVMRWIGILIIMFGIFVISRT